jgi:hypothetical protein
MTDKETLFSYRLQQGEETLSEAKKMLEDGLKETLKRQTHE